MDQDDFGENVLINLDVESLNPVIVKHEKQEKSGFFTSRKCYSYIKKKVCFISNLQKKKIRALII